MPAKKAKRCQICKTPFQGRKDAKTCSPACRKRLQRNLLAMAAQKAKRLESALGQEFHRIAATLLQEHVLHEPLVVADERGSIAVAEPPTETSQEAESLEGEPLVSEPVASQPAVSSQIPVAAEPQIQSTALPREADQRFTPPITKPTPEPAPLETPDVQISQAAPIEEQPAPVAPAPEPAPVPEPEPVPEVPTASVAAPQAIHLEDMMSTESLEPSASGQAEDMEPADAGMGEPPKIKSGVGSFSLFRYNRVALMATGLALLAIAVISVSSFFVLSKHNPKPLASKSSAGNYAVGDLPLSNLGANPSLTVGEANQVTINGQLRVNQTLVLAPSGTPTAPVTGQIYYDKAANAPYYYNGSQFVSLAPGVSSLGGSKGDISLGSGLAINGNQLDVSSLLQQQINNANSTANSGVRSLTGTANQVSVSSATGNITLSLPQSIAVASTPTFGGLTVNGTLSVASIQHPGAGSDLNISAGNDGITFVSGGRTFTLPTSGPASQTICTTGFSCAIGPGTAVELQPGTAQTDTGSGSSIFINNTGGGNLLQLQGSGADNFVVDNAGNLTASNLTVGTVNGATIASTGINGAAISGTTINGQTISSSANFTGTVAIQGASSLSLGTVANTGNIIFHDGASANVGSLQLGGTLSGGVTYDLPVATGTQTICTIESGNCAGSGSGVTTPGGTIGALAYFTGSQQISNSIVSQSGTTLTTAGNQVVNAANGFVGNLLNLEVNGSSKLTVNESGNLVSAGTIAVNGTGASSVAGSLSVGTGLMVTTGGADITGTTTINGNGIVTGTLDVQGTNALRLGVASTTTGAIVFRGSGGNGTLTLQGPAIPSIGNYTVTIPAITANANICTDNSICAGYAPAGGSNNYIQNGTTAQTADFNITGTGTAGTLNATTAIELAGNDINSAGTLSNVAYLNASNNFTGTTNTFSATGGTSLAVTGTPTNSATASLIQIGSAISGGNSSVNGGTYIGLNEPNSGAGSGADFLNFQKNGASQFKVTNTGALSAGAITGGSTIFSSGGGSAVAFKAVKPSGNAVLQNFLLSTDVNPSFQINGDGTINFGAGGASATDTTLSRASAGVLQTGGAFNAVTGYQLNGTQIVDASRNLTNIGTISSGLINGQTISSSANFTGTVAVQGAGGITVGVAGATAGSLNLANASNTNLSVLQAAAPSGSGNATYTLPSIAGGGSDTICLVALGNCAGSGSGVTTPGGTPGALAVFTGSQSIGDSVISQSGSAVSVAGTLAVTGSGSLSLGSASANTGSVKLYNSSNGNSLTLQAGATASNLTLTLPTADGTNGQCLQTNGLGVLSFNPCTGGSSGGVTSLDGLTGVLTLANSSGSGATITIDNAAADGVTKGIATFNSTNFTASSGVINTVQDIATSSSPVFVSPNATTGINTGAGAGTQRIDASGNLVNIGSVTTSGAINGQTITSSANFTGTVAIQGSNALSLGSASTNTGAISFYNSAGTHTITLQGPATDPAANYILTIPTLTGDDTLCLATLANCTAIGAAGGDLSGSYPDPNVAKLQGTTLTLSSLASGDVLQYNGSAIVNGHISNNNLSIGSFGNIQGVGTLTSGSIASGFGTISTGNTITTSGALHGNTLTVGSSNQFQVDASGNLTITNTASILGSNGLTLGNAGSTAGLLSFANASNTNLTVVQAAAPSGSGNASITIPSIAGGTSDTVCLFTLGNCAHAAGGVTTPGGTIGQLAYFSNTNEISNSIVSQSGTTLTVAGNQIVNAANGFVGNLLNLEVNNSSKLSVSETGNITNAGTLTVSGTGASSVAGSLSVGTGLTVSAGGASITGNSTVTGTLAVTSLGAADTTAVLCRNSSNQIATCSGTGSGSPFVQGGNAFGATAVLGTTDANGLQIITGSSGPNGRAYFDTSNNLYLGNAGTAGTASAPNNFSVLGTGSSTVGTAGATLTVKGGAGSSTSTGSAGGGLTLQGGDAGGSGVNNGGTLTLDSGAKTSTGTSTINLGTTNATILNVGNTTAATTTLINGGTGASAIGIQAGTSGTISIGTTNVNTVTVGSTSNTGTLTFGRSTAGETINIANATVATGKTNTINIGSSATGTGKDTITIGSTNGASSTTIRGGTGGISLNAGSNNVSIGGTGGQQALTLVNGGNIASNMFSPACSGATPTTGTGSLAAGTYFYQVTALDGSGGEAAPACEVSATLASTGEITVNYVSISSGISSYRIYRGTSSGAENVYYTTTNSSSFVDTGASSTAGTPPATTTAYTYKLNAGGNSWLNGGNVGIGTAAPGQTLSVLGTASFQSATNSTTAFQIQNAAGTSNLLVADTTNSRIGLGVTPITTSGSGLLQVGASGSTTAAQGISFGGDTSANLYRSAAGILSTDGALVAASSVSASTFSATGSGTTVAYKAIKPAGNNVLQNFLLSTDANPAFQVQGSGQLSWGAGGASAVDTNLYRSSASVLKTDGGLIVGTLGTGGNVALCSNAGQLSTCSTGTGSPFVQGGNSFGATATLGTNDSNSLTFETNNATQATIAVGGATTFQNSADSTTAFQIQNAAGTSNLFVADTTNTRIGIGAAPANALLTVGSNTTTAAGGIYFGTDTHLYRGGSGVLKTDGGFQAAGQLVAQNGTANQVNVGSSCSGSAASLCFNSDTNLYRSAASTLTTDGNLTVSGHGAVGSGASAVSTRVLNVSETRADTSSAFAGVYGQLTENPTANSSVTTYGNYTLAQTGSGNTHNFTGVFTGTFSQAIHQGTGTVTGLGGLTGSASTSSNGNVTSAWGVYGNYLAGGSGTTANADGVTALVGNNAGGTITVAAGLDTSVQNYTTGTIGTGYGLLVESAGNAGGGTFSNNYGIYIQDQSGVGSVNSYNLYSAGATAKNYIAGTLEVGSTVKVDTLGTTNTATALCLNASNQIAGCSGTGTGSAFVQGGNSFGATATLGTNDSNSLSFETNGSTQATIAVGGATTFKNSTDSTTAFQIQDSTSNVLFSADTTNDQVTVGPALFGLTNSNAALGGGLVSNVKLSISTGNIGLRVRETSTSDLLLLQNNTTNVVEIGSTGNTLFQNSADSTTAFQIQNAAGTSNLLVADTTNSRIGLGVTPITTAGAGLLQVGAASSTTAAQGISFGGDTSANLYRSAAGTLTTDGNLGVGGGLTVSGTPAASSTSSLIQIGSALSGGNSNGTYIGLNQPAASTADLINLQHNGSSAFKVTSAGYTSTIQAFQLTNTSNASGQILKSNIAGGSINSGDVVSIKSNGTAVVSSTTAKDTQVYGVATSTQLTAGQTVSIAIAGNATINVDSAAVNIGDQLVTTATAGVATADNSATTGIVGVALSSKAAGSSGTVSVMVRPVNGQTNPTIAGNLTVTGTINGATISGGTLTATAVNSLNVSGTAISGTGALTVDANGANTVSIGGISTGDILLGGGSGSTGCTVTNSNGNLTCTGSITGASTGTVGYWSRSGTTLQPATAGDSITTSGNISTTSSGTLSVAGTSTFTGQITANGGITSPGAGTSSEYFGSGASVSTFNSALAVGNGATVTGNTGTAIGKSATANGSSTALGAAASAAGGNSVAIGYSSSAASGSSIAIGRSATTTASNQLVIGADTYAIQNAYIGNGVTDATPLGFTLQATGGSGTDIAGASVNIAGGKGTGAGNGGNINFQIAKPGTTGSSLNSLGTVFSLSGSNGAALFQNSADSTTAFQVQNAAGTATAFGVDTTHLTVGIAATPAATIGLTVWAGTSNIGQVIDQSSSNTNGLLVLRHNGTDVAVVGSTGNTTFKNSTDSTTAFQIQNAAGTSNLLVADTTNSRIGLGVTPITTAGAGLLQVGAASSTTAAQGISFGGDTSANLYRSAAGILKTDGGLNVVGHIGIGTAPTGNPLEIQGASGVSVNLATTTNLSTDSAYLQVNNRARFGYSNGAILIDDNNASKGLNVNLYNGTTSNTVFALTGTTGAATFKPTTGNDSTTAFRIQNAAGSSTVFTADTQNIRVGIGGSPANGVLTVGTNTTASSGGIYFGNDTGLYRSGSNTLQVTGNFSATSNIYGTRISSEQATDTDTRVALDQSAGGAGKAGLLFGSGAATADTNLYRDAASVLKTDDALIVGTNSATAFQVQDTNAASFLTVDTTNQQVVSGRLSVGAVTGNRVFSDNYETGSFGLWNTTVGTPTIDTTTVFAGKYSEKVATTNAATYEEKNISGSATMYVRGYVYVASQSGSTNATFFSLYNSTDTFSSSQISVYRQSGGNVAIWSGPAGGACLTGGALSTGAWHKIEAKVVISNTGSCQLTVDDGTPTTSGTVDTLAANNPNRFTIGTPNTTETYTGYFDEFAVDTVPIDNAGSLTVQDTFHAGGSATFSGTTLVQAANDSTTAFQIQNASGTDVFTVDTVNLKVGTADQTAASTNSNTLTIQSGNASGATSNSGNVVIDSGTATGTAGNISIGTGAYAHNTTIGNATGSSALTLQAGTGGISLGNNGVANTIQIGTTTGAVTQAINIGNNATASSVTNVIIGNLLGSNGSTTLIQGGTGSNAIKLSAGSAGTVTVGSTTATNTVTIGVGGSGTLNDTVNINNTSGATTGAVTIGGSGAATGNITLGQSTGSQTVRIGIGAVAAGKANIVNIGSVASATTGTNTINIGATATSTNGATTVTILAGNNSGSTTAGQSTGINVSLGNTASTTAVCSSLATATNATSGTAYELRDCSGTPVADYAENYPVASDVQVGDVVSLGSQMIDTYGIDTANAGVPDWNHSIGQISQLIKTNRAYEPNTIGIVSDNNDDFSSVGYNIKDSDNPKPIAMNGRVLVNFSTENGTLEPGDYITSSATKPGYAMKATQAGYVIGQALSSYTSSGDGQVMVFVRSFYYPGPSNSSYLQNGSNASFASLDVNGNTTLANLDVSGDTNLANLNVSGPSTLASLTVTGDASVGGNLTVTGSATIANLTVTGDAHFKDDITIDGHIVTAGGQPTAQTQTAIGTGASVSVDGTDTTGTITITTGSAPSAGDLAKILFSKTYGAAPHIVLSPSNDKAAGLHFYKGSTSATDFMFDTTDTPAANTTYTFDYFIAQ